MTDLHDIELASGGHKTHPHPWTKGTVFDTYKTDCPPIVIIKSIKNQSLQRQGRIADRRGNVMYHCLKHIIDIQPGFCGDAGGKACVQPDDILNFTTDFFRLRGRKIDFVDYRYNFQIMIQSHINICKCLSFNSLCCINDQKGVTGDSELDFLQPTEHAEETADELTFRILKDIYQTLQANEDSARRLAAKRQRNRKLLEVIARKQDQELEGKSIEELEKMLEEE